VREGPGDAVVVIGAWPIMVVIGAWPMTAMLQRWELGVFFLLQTSAVLCKDSTAEFTQIHQGQSL
jgi:hypothetical protein